MKMHVSKDWLRKKIQEDIEPEGCPACGAIAGCCDKYPECPGNPEWHNEAFNAGLEAAAQEAESLDEQSVANLIRALKGET